MPIELSWPGFPDLQAKLARLSDPDPTPVLEAIRDVIRLDNHDGVMAGLDCNGAPLTVTKRQLDPDLSAKFGSGPPLAPKGEGSRAIDRLRTAFFADGPGQWVVIGAWEDVLSKSGVPFLPFHFRGEGHLPTRDLAGLRPDGWAKAGEVVDLWATHLLDE